MRIQTAIVLALVAISAQARTQNISGYLPVDGQYRQVDLMVDSHSGLVDGYDYKRKEFVYGQVDSLGNIEMRGSRTRTTQTIDALDLSNYR